MRIYTRKGDDGQTSIWGGRRIAKDEARMEAIGAVDECNAAVGLAAATLDHYEPVTGLLADIQRDLMVAGSELMAPDRTGSGSGLPRLTADDVTRLETAIDRLEADLPELRNFILPGGTPAAAHLHLARTLCRRAERRVTTLRRQHQTGPHLVPYLNRLSDLLFVMARHANHHAGTDDTVWAPRS